MSRATVAPAPPLSAGAAGPRTVTKARTRQRLLEVAVRLFGERGIAATTTADVARAAGVSHGAVFVHFTTREDLVAAVVDRYGHEAATRTHELARRGTGVRSVLTAHLECLREHEDFHARLVSEAAALPRPARLALIGIQSALALHLEQAATAKGTKIRRMPAHLLFNTWIALVHYYLANREIFAPGESVLDRCGPELIDHMMDLLRPGGS